MRALLTLPLIALMSGCVMVGAEKLPSTYKRELKPASSLATSYTGSLGGWVSLSKEHCSANISSPNNENFHTKEELLKNWGPPHKIEIKDNTEKFIYNGKIRWSGTVIGSLFLIVPVYIPLIFPSGREYCSVILTDGLISSTESVKRENATSYDCHINPFDTRPNHKIGCFIDKKPY